MAKDPENHAKPSSDADVQKLRELARANAPTRAMGVMTGRTTAAVRQKAGSESISLKPTNRGPYGTKKA